MINSFNTKKANINIFNEYLIRYLQVHFGVNDYKIQKTLILADKLHFFPKKSVLCQTNNKILTSSRLQSATEKLSLTYTLKQKQ